MKQKKLDAGIGPKESLFGCPPDNKYTNPRAKSKRAESLWCREKGGNSGEEGSTSPKRETKKEVGQSEKKKEKMKGKNYIGRKQRSRSSSGLPAERAGTRKNKGLHLQQEAWKEKLWGANVSLMERLTPGFRVGRRKMETAMITDIGRKREEVTPF